MQFETLQVYERVMVPGVGANLKELPRFVCFTVRCVRLKYIGMRHMVSVKSDSRSNVFWIKRYEAT